MYFSKSINQFRVKELGLSSMSTFNGQNVPQLCFFSESVVTRPKDWPLASFFVGYPYISVDIFVAKVGGAPQKIFFDIFDVLENEKGINLRASTGSKRISSPRTRAPTSLFGLWKVPTIQISLLCHNMRQKKKSISCKKIKKTFCYKKNKKVCPSKIWKILRKYFAKFWKRLT